jgi:outer membrane lipoprotein-sorting protein
MNKPFKSVLSAIAAVILFSGFAAIDSKAQGIPNEILTLMENNRKAMTSLKADIKMENHDPNIGDDSKSGKVLYAAARDKKGRDTDTLMRLEWLTPKNEIISVANKKFIIWDVKGGIAYTGSANSSKVKDGQGGGLVKLLTSSSKEELKSKFTFEYLGKENVAGASVWHLKLTPKTKQSYKFADIWIDGNGMPLQAMATAVTNDTQTITLSNLDKNVSVDKQDFIVKVPSNIKKQSV